MGPDPRADPKMDPKVDPRAGTFLAVFKQAGATGVRGRVPL